MTGKSFHEYTNPGSSRVGRFLLRFLIPGSRREEVLGDLLEEANHYVLPERGRRRAHVWFWREVITSSPHMIARRIAWEAEMNSRRWIVAATILVVGLLQAWDSKVLDAPVWVGAVVLIAVLIPAIVGFVTARKEHFAYAVVVSFVLLFAVRIASPTPLPGLGLVAFVAAMALAFGFIWSEKTKAA